MPVGNPSLPLALPSQMDYLYPRIVDHPPARQPHPFAPVHILEVEEEVFIHSADLINDFPPHA